MAPSFTGIMYVVLDIFLAGLNRCLRTERDEGTLFVLSASIAEGVSLSTSRSMKSPETSIILRIFLDRGYLSLMPIDYSALRAPRCKMEQGPSPRDSRVVSPSITW